MLSKIPGLHVAARTSSFYFKGKNATAQDIGSKLGVANLVEGSVRRSGNSVRISARLSRAATGEQLWSESYTRDLSDVFAVQTELAQTIVAQLRQQLGVSVAKEEIAAQVQAAEKWGTTNVEAHRLYLEGRFYLYQTSVDSINKGAALLRNAVDLDPNYALAWAALSRAGDLINGFGVTKEDVNRGLELARTSAERALQIAPDLAAAYLAEANVQEDKFDWKGRRRLCCAWPSSWTPEIPMSWNQRLSLQWRSGTPIERSTWAAARRRLTRSTPTSRPTSHSLSARRDASSKRGMRARKFCRSLLGTHGATGAILLWDCRGEIRSGPARG